MAGAGAEAAAAEPGPGPGPEAAGAKPEPGPGAEAEPEAAKPEAEGPAKPEEEGKGGEAAEGEEAAPPPGPRYFLMKVRAFPSVQKAMEHGVWAVAGPVAEKLGAAFAGGGDVWLAFSVNLSGHFQGFARMTGRVHEVRLDLFASKQPLLHHFPLEWECHCDMPYEKVAHLKNALNAGKSVKAGKDGQEISAAEGAGLCEAMRADPVGAKHGRPPKPRKRIDLAEKERKEQRLRREREAKRRATNSLGDR